jgi:hypothetical protein
LHSRPWKKAIGENGVNGDRRHGSDRPGSQQDNRRLGDRLIVAAAPSPALAWGAAAHRYIMRRAMDLLPPEMRPFFIDHRDELVMRVNDPDLWRVDGFDDDTNHFMNFGMPEL